MDLVSLVDGFRCVLQDGTSMALPQLASQSHYAQLPFHIAVQFSAWLVPPTIIWLHDCHDSEQIPCWRIDKFRLKLHMSEFEGGPNDFLESLKVGRLEFIFVAKGWYNAYFLIIEPQPSISWSSRRVGAAEALWFSDGASVALQMKFNF